MIPRLRLLPTFGMATIFLFSFGWGRASIGQETPSIQQQLLQVGQSILRLDGPALAELALSSNAENARGIWQAALVVGVATGDQETVASAKQRLPEFHGANASLLSELKPTTVSIAPESLTPDVIKILKDTRRALVIAAVTQDKGACQAILDDLNQEQTPPEIRQPMLKFAESGKAVAGLLNQPMLATSVGFAKAVGNFETGESTLLAHFRSANDEQKTQLAQTRSGGANRYTVMAAKEAERADLVSAYSDLYRAYLEGVRTEVEVIREMQEVQSKYLDLKEKRALLYWTLRNLRAENLKARRDATIARNRQRTEAYEAQTAESMSLVWPTVFRHRELSQNAKQLREALRQYSPENSGPLSICCSRCESHIKSLQEKLNQNLVGISVQQRAALRRYLRKLGAEVNCAYTPSSYIVKLNEQDAIQSSFQVASTEFGDTNSTPISVSLVGDDMEIASLSLYRSLAKSLVRAGKAGDKRQLVGLAAAIRDSELLTADYKKRLKEIGSRAFRGKLTAADLKHAESPRLVLQEIAGVQESGGGNSLDLPPEYVTAAFELLISNTVAIDTSN